MTMRDMRKKLARAAVVLSMFGYVGCAYENPAQPGPPVVNLSAPAQVTVGAAPGAGAQSGTATVSATVQNVNGAALSNVVVTFVTSRGTIAPAQVPTGANGVASATLTANDTADVTASVGTLSAHTLVVATGGNTPPTTPTLPVAFLNVSGSATTGVPVVFSVSSSVTGATWNWSFGDGANEQGTAFTTTHTYTQTGTYTASVSSASTSTGSATITVTPSTGGTTPAPAGFVASMTCPTSTTLTQACNVAATVDGAPLPSASITNVTWDWGDGKTDANLTTPVMTHIYANAGTYTVFASVTGAPPLGNPKTVTTSQSVTVPFK
jgi:PKD domain-containing protein